MTRSSGDTAERTMMAAALAGKSDKMSHFCAIVM